MSAAAGAPPPPPPPPPPKKSFIDLPAELLLNIIRFLRTEDYVQFALAIYPVLEHHGLVPPLTLEIYRRITFQASLPATTGYGTPHRGEQDEGGDAARDAPGPSNRSLARNRGEITPSPVLPVELQDLIMGYLEPSERIAWIFSHRYMIWEYQLGVSEATRRRLWDAMQKSKTK